MDKKPLWSQYQFGDGSNYSYLIDADMIRDGIEYATYLEEHFSRISDSVSEIKRILSSRLATLSIDEKSIDTRVLFDKTCRDFVYETLCSVYEDEQYHIDKRIFELIVKFIPSGKIVGPLYMHLHQNTGRTYDVLGIKGLVEEQLKNMIINEFQSFAFINK